MIQKLGFVVTIILGSIVSSPASAQWSGTANVDAMTDFVGWTAQVVGSGTGGVATLIVRCIDDRTDVIVSTDYVLGGTSYDRTEIRLRFDSEPAETQSWQRSTSYLAAFAIDRIGLARRLALTTAKELRVRVTPFNRGGVDFVFPLGGAAKQIENVARRCGWSFTEKAKPARKGTAPGSSGRAPSSATGSRVVSLPQSTIDEVKRSLQRNYNEVTGSIGSTTISFDVTLDGSGKLLGRPKLITPGGPLDAHQAALRRSALISIIRVDEERGFRSVPSGTILITFKAGGFISISEYRPG